MIGSDTASFDGKYMDMLLPVHALRVCARLLLMSAEILAPSPVSRPESTVSQYKYILHSLSQFQIPWSTRSSSCHFGQRTGPSPHVTAAAAIDSTKAT